MKVMVFVLCCEIPGQPFVSRASSVAYVFNQIVLWGPFIKVVNFGVEEIMRDVI